MKHDDFVTIEKKYDDYNIYAHINGSTTKHTKKEKVILIFSLFTVFVAALLVTGIWFGNASPTNNGEDGLIAVPTDGVMPTDEVAPSVYPTPIVTTEPIKGYIPISYTINTSIKSIDDLYTTGVLNGTVYENRKFYCSDITPYFVKQKTKCQVFFFWDTLDAIVIYNNKIIILELGTYEYVTNMYDSEKIPEILPCDFNGDGTYELLFNFRSNLYLNELNEIDKPSGTWGTRIVHLDLNTLQYNVIEEFKHGHESYFFLREVTDSVFEIYKFISNANTTDDIFFGNFIYENNKINFKPSEPNIKTKPDPWEYSIGNINSISWSMDIEFDLDCDNEKEKYTFERNAGSLILKSENEKLITMDIGWLFINSATIKDIDEQDMNNDGKKEICIIAIEKLGRDYMVVTIVISNINGEYKRFFRANHLQGLEFKKVSNTSYDLYWCTEQKTITINFPDESFFTPTGDRELIVKPKSNIPRSCRIDVINGEPTIVIEWSMYIDGYTGRLETLVTRNINMLDTKVNYSYDFNIEYFLGKPASNEDFSLYE